MRLGVLTSVDIRHRFFANALRRACDVVAVGYERTGYTPADINAYDLSPDERRVVDAHFDDRRRQEARCFGHDAALIDTATGCDAFHIAPGMLNTRGTHARLEAAGVDALAVFGTNLIKDPLLQRWAGRIINMHLGLSPYYRGTATNFYPLLNEEPQYVGATIHLIDAGIDSGPIIHHARPDIDADDTPHTIGCNAILAGIDKMIAALAELSRGELVAVPQWPVADARLYLRRDYHPRDVVKLHHKVQAGLIADYAARAKDVAPAVKLID